MKFSWDNFLDDFVLKEFVLWYKRKLIMYHSITILKIGTTKVLKTLIALCYLNNRYNSKRKSSTKSLFNTLFKSDDTWVFHSKSFQYFPEAATGGVLEKKLLRSATLLKWDSGTIVFLSVLWNSQEHLFTEHLWTTASDFLNNLPYYGELLKN